MIRMSQEEGRQSQGIKKEGLTVGESKTDIKEDCIDRDRIYRRPLITRSRWFFFAKALKPYRRRRLCIYHIIHCGD